MGDDGKSTIPVKIAGPKAMDLYWCECGAVVWDPGEHRLFCPLLKIRQGGTSAKG